MKQVVIVKGMNINKEHMEFEELHVESEFEDEAQYAELQQALIASLLEVMRQVRKAGKAKRELPA